MIHDPLKAISKYCDKTREELLEQLISLRERLEKQKVDFDRCCDEANSLRESEKKYRFLVENSKDIIWQIDLEGRWRFVSSNVKSILGYEPGQVIGKAIWDFIAPEFHDIVKKNIDLRLKGEERPPYEVEIIARDGHRVPFELMASVAMNKNGIITGIQGISRDIVYRKQAEEQLKRSYEELETRVRERTSELTEINQKLQKEINERKRAEEALSDAKAQAELYLDLMGHDINNLNQVALGFLELADDTIKSGDRLGEDNKELIEKPMVSLNSSTRLIDKVMKLRKLKTRELRLEQVDICNVLEKVKNRYSHVAGRDVTINYVPPTECLVMANELIDEIFINLIENSIKHSPPGRPLVIDIQQTQVCEDGEEFSRISVEDNGPGIPDSVKERLFTRFYRGRTLAKGKGLGLYLVKTLVENFSGKVLVEDRIPGDHRKGSKFVVILPSAD